ncbi:hypothetical protein D6029_11605 [Buttiauxella izardii]|uniref:Uncharacterized protein n=1 Tax=Buttiauxella izardii TaxID=82991 RepID=A0A3A5JSI5_9ENTR|nr:hypothetical protein D6029_11605 [Buttiauxella izardii]
MKSAVRFSFRQTKPSIATDPDSDANVTFCLNLPLNEGVNHKAKTVIALAYDQNRRHMMQSIHLEKCETLRINRKCFRQNLALANIYHHFRNKFTTSLKTWDEKK